MPDKKSPLIPGGYILLSRRIIEDQIWKKPPLYLKVWTWLLAKATRKGYGDLKPGQVRISIDEIREAMSYLAGYRKVKPSRKQVWNVVDYLRNPHERDAKGIAAVTTKVTHGLIVTVCKYNHYQNPKNYEGNSEGNDEKDTGGTQGEQYIQEGDKKGKEVSLRDKGHRSTLVRRGPRKVGDVLDEVTGHTSKPLSPVPPDAEGNSKYPSAEQIEAALKKFFGAYQNTRWPRDTTTKRHCLTMQQRGYVRDEFERAFETLAEKYSSEDGKLRMVNRYFSPAYELLDKLQFQRRT